MKIILAQGNPGVGYQSTRHNIGFTILDEIAKQWGVAFSHKSKFQADIAETVIDGEKVLLVKPTTFYNETGQTARLLQDFYKLDPSLDFLVIHDELALPIGTIKIRHSGSDAGNNGIKSLNNHIGKQYSRIRIGIYTPRRDKMNDADFVLDRFPKEEQVIIKKTFPTIEAFVRSFIAGTLEATRVIHDNS
jgi:PTH1 family peptidyl-tRNA hydrolase